MCKHCEALSEVGHVPRGIIQVNWKHWLNTKTFLSVLWCFHCAGYNTQCRRNFWFLLPHTLYSTRKLKFIKLAKISNACTLHKSVVKKKLLIFWLCNIQFRLHNMCSFQSCDQRCDESLHISYFHALLFCIKLHITSRSSTCVDNMMF